MAEIGFYAYGMGVFSAAMIETFSPILSVRNFGGDDPGRLDVRDATDTASGVFLLGTGEIGSQGDAIDFILGDPTPGSRRIDLAALKPAPNGATSLLVQVNREGETSIRRVELGPMNSAGDGYRTLRVEN